MAIRWAISSGNFSSTATWNDGATLGIPTTGDDVYSNSFTVSMDSSFTVNTLNSVARARTIATPLMTANNAPSPYVAAASSQSGGQPFLAFDRNYTSATNFWQAAAGVPQWLSIDFGSSIIIDAYTVFGTSNQVANPRNWTFEGSNNNVSWTTLHTVTLPAAIAGGSSYSSGSISNLNAYRYYRINVSLTGGNPPAITELELYELFTAALAAGGSFNFNTAGVTGNITSSSPLVPGATNMVQVTATTGTVTISLGGNVTPPAIASANLILYNGNCNLNISGTNFNGLIATTANNTSCINKTSAGLITITGNLNGGNGGGNATGAQVFVSTNGNTIVIGNIVGGIGSAGGNRGINQSSGTLTITGNVTGGQSIVTNQGVIFTGTSLTVNGTILGGTAATAIDSSAPVNNITGNVTSGTVAAIASSSANIINVTGTVTASATAQAISMTNANGQVYLNGNMVNVNGRMAIYAPIVWLDSTGTTQADFFTSGGSPRTLYSEDTFPNMPAQNNTRFNTVYGPGNGLRGTVRMPAAADARSGVVYDNGTTGTALFTTSLLLTEISTSSDPVAERIRNGSTPQILGELMEAFKK